MVDINPCIICFCNNKPPKQHFKCNCIFSVCTSCLSTWTSIHCKCPICRTDIEFNDLSMRIKCNYVLKKYKTNIIFYLFIFAYISYMIHFSYKQILSLQTFKYFRITCNPQYCFLYVM